MMFKHRSQIMQIITPLLAIAKNWSIQTTNLDGETVTIISSDDFVNEIISKYDFMYFNYYTNSEQKSTHEIELNYLYNSFLIFLNKNNENIHKEYLALFSDYNPIENYAMEESSNSSETPSNETITSTPSKTNATATTTTSANQIKDYTTTFDDSTTGRLQSYTDTPEITVENNVETVGNTTIRTNTVKTNTNTLTRHGNIGVTTSQQMAESEIKLRFYNMVDNIVKKFISDVCFYAGGCDYNDDYTF